MNTAFCKSLGTRFRTNRVCRLLNQQRFITVEGVQAAQTFLQMRLELGQGQLHESKI
jgi:hypothetical protein